MIWLALLFLIGCSGSVSASETALFALRPPALYACRVSRSAMTRRVSTLMESPRRVLMTVLMANTAVNVAIFAVSFVAMRRLSHTHPSLAAAFGLGVLAAVILFGEMVPKALALSHAQRCAPIAAALIAVLQTLLAPVLAVLSVLLVDPITRLLSPADAPGNEISAEELRLLVQESAAQGIIDSRETEMLHAVIALDDAKVREIMKPRVDVEAVSLNQTEDEIHNALVATRRRRLLVCGKDLDDIRGVILVRTHLMNPGTPLASAMESALFVPEQCTVVQLLRQFRTHNSTFAVVVDEYGGTAGVVTMDELVRHVVGESLDEEGIDVPKTPEQINEDTYRIAGALGARVWADAFGIDEIDRGVDTVGGLILSRLGRLPTPGDVVHLRNLTLTVETMVGYRIVSVLLSRARVETDAEDQSSPEPAR